MILTDYLQGLVAHFTDARIVRNLTDLVQNIVEHTSIRLWSISHDRAEFERSKRLVNGTLNAVVDEQTVAEALRENGGRKVALSVKPEDFVVLLHDPCDIRKANSKDLECLGTVRSLDGALIPGYQTFNTVVLNESGHTPQPLDISVYSNGDPHYVTEEELTQYQKRQSTPSDRPAPQTLPPDRASEIQQFLDDDSYVNLNRVFQRQLTRVSEHMQQQAPQCTRCHVLDRQFDGNRYVTLIDKE